MKFKKAMAEMLEKVAKTAAKDAAGSASWWNAHQPKEPANLKKLLNK